MAVHAGQRLGRYTLVRPLGRGGGGEAWEAVLNGPLGFTRPVAVKLLPDGAVRGQDRENLLREARIGALLQHPNLVATHELAEADGVVFLAMELVEGPTVKELARGHALPGAVILDVGVQACAGLAHLHDAAVDGAPLGLVHRDVKPGNLLVDATGVVKLADFGISRTAGEGGHGSGTPGYAPPEQFEGGADPRSDVFALGATLAALILGEPPFGRGRVPDRAAMERRLADPDLRARLDAGLRGGADVVLRCLSPRPDDRFPTAAAVRDALEALRRRQDPAPPLRDLVTGHPTRSAAPAPAPDGEEVTVRARGNLPAPTDPWVPRAELSVVGAALDAGHRWLALTGPGGMGKTRLALEVARARNALGSWFFDLGEASTPDAVASALTGPLRLELGPADDPLARVGHALRALGPVVAVLDDVDGALRAVPDLAPRLLAAAPELRLVATARVAAGAGAEHRVPVGPLPTSAGAALFRARVARPLLPAEQADVVALVEAVDGMPLAIELLAARAARVPLAALRVDLAAHLAGAADPDRPRRTRTVEAAFAATWDALPPWGRRALGQLAVFEGPFSARAVTAVLDPATLGGRGPLDALELLTEAGLLRYDGDRRRFSASRLARDFALARLDPAPRARAERRHGQVYAGLGDRDVLALIRGPQGVERFRRLADDTDQLRAAADRALDRADTALVVPLLRALTAVWIRQGPLPALITRLDRAIGLPDLAPADRDELQLASARALRARGELPAARSLLEDTLRAIRARPTDPATPRLEAEALELLARTLSAAMEGGLAEVLGRDAVEAADRTGDPGLQAEAALALGGILGSAARVEEGRAWLDVALRGFRRLGSDRDEARVLSEIGRVEHLCGRYPPARAAFEQALERTRRARDAAAELAVLRNLGLLEKDLRRSADAERLYREGLAVAESVGDRSGEMWLWGAIGYLHLEQREPAGAEAPLARAVALAEALADPMLCQWEAALARLAALAGRPGDARALIERALSRDAGRASTLRVWVRAAAAEVAWRAGRRDEARAELDALEKWLAARHVDPGSRMHQEVQRVRVLCTESRR